MAKVAIVSNVGRLLVFDFADLPKLAKGKGNKLIAIPKTSFNSGDEFVVTALCFMSLIS